MKKEESFQIRPFKQHSTSDILDALILVSPRVGSFPTARKGIRRAMKRLRDLCYGIISKQDAEDMKSHIETIYVEAEYAMLYCVTLLGKTTFPIRDYAEYRAFSNLCLPMNDEKPGLDVWTMGVKEGVRQHFTAMASLKSNVKSSPKYRKKGHDYCEDMMEMVARIIMRPALVRFTKRLEGVFGWSSVIESGILKYADVKPKTQ